MAEVGASAGRAFRAAADSLSGRPGDIALVVFNVNDWDDAPASLTIEGTEVRLEGLTAHQAKTLAVIGTNGEHVTLVVVPSDTAAPMAMRSLTSASQAEPADAAADAEERALHEVVELLARQEASIAPKRTAQISRR